METMTPGNYVILRTSGAAERFTVAEHGKPSISRIEKLIGAYCLDTVNLGRLRSGVVMLVNDTGNGLPVNLAATALYRSICKAGTTWEIRGDVALVNDEDFA